MILVLACPHCQESFTVAEEDIRCAIFRHASYKHNLEPIPPHSSKDECDRLLEQNQIYGCAKPFRIILTEQGYKTEICDYI
jgi:hypothetical protein